MRPLPVGDAGRIVAVNAFLAVLLLIAVYVRHWAVLVLWLGLLVGLPIGMVSERRGGEIALLSFFGWLLLGAAIAVAAGRPEYAGFVAMTIVLLNYLAFSWDRPPPAPSKPTDPAFGDPLFASAAFALVVGGTLVLMAAASLIPELWVGPACGVSGFALALLVIAMARWRLPRENARP